MKRLIILVILTVMLIAGCDFAGISITTRPVVSSFSASPSSIAVGNSSDISWSVIGATTVNIDQGIGNVATSGTRVVVPSATTVYTLTATSGSGVSVNATTQVVVTGTVTPPTPPTPTPPTPSGLPVIYSFTASPSNISAGYSSTLSWNVSNATSISIDHEVGSVGASGTTYVFPTTSTTYTLTALNAAGASTQSTAVFVSAVPSFTVTSVYATAEPPSFTGACPVTVNFYADITVNGPGTVTYRWESSDGGAEATQSIYFSSAGSQIVSTSSQVNISGTYWVRVHVFTPNEMISNQASFTVSCASGPTAGWAGTWETTYGTMILTQTENIVSGYYEHSNGTISGTVSGNVLTGTWAESPTHLPPDDAGDVQLTLSGDGLTFTGGWRFDSSGSWNMNWNGTKIF